MSGILTIEVIAGRGFFLDESAGQRSNAFPSLRLFVPDDSHRYSLRNLLSKISSKYPALAALFLDDRTGGPKGNVVILLNGTHIDLVNGLDSVLKAGDRVVFVPFLDGG